jgi:hypothetical protein
MRTRLFVTLALATAALTGCAARRLAYVVDAPPDVAAEDAANRPPRVVAAAMTSDRGLVAVSLRWPSSSELRVEEAWLAPAGGAPCEGRLAATMAVDGATSWDRPVTVGPDQALEIAFPLSMSDARSEVGAPPPAPATVDLRVGARGAPARCERVPWPSPSSWRKAGRWSAGARILFEPPGPPAASAVARVGRWVGPLRVGAELGVSMRQCAACLSALYLGLPAALTAEVAAATRAGVALGLELAYTARPVRGTDAGDHYLLYGPRVTLRFGAAAPRNDGLPGGPMLSLDTFDLWWAHVAAAGVAHWSQTLFGVGWSWDVGL